MPFKLTDGERVAARIALNNRDAIAAAYLNQMFRMKLRAPKDPA